MMKHVVIGIDPSFTGFGMCDGERCEVVSTKPVPDVLEEVSVIQRIDFILKELQLFVSPIVERHVRCYIDMYVEAPILNSSFTNNHSIYQLGALYIALHRWGAQLGITVYQTDRSSIMHAHFGKRVIKKDEVSGYAHRKFGVLFERDPGLNKLHAFLVYRFGCGVRDGEYGITVAARPGANRSAKLAAKQRRNSNEST